MGTTKAVEPIETAALAKLERGKGEGAEVGVQTMIDPHINIHASNASDDALINIKRPLGERGHRHRRRRIGGGKTGSGRKKIRDRSGCWLGPRRQQAGHMLQAGYENSCS